MKSIAIFLVLPIFLIVSCKPTEKDEISVTGVTREEVVTIATKYGLQDSIADGYVSPHFKPFPREAYPALTKEFWDSYFARWRKFSDEQKEFIRFRRESASVTSVTEYYQLIEKYPSVYQSRVNAHGGIEGYNRQKSEIISGNWHIYLSKDSAIVFIPSDHDDGTYPGKRLDKGN